NMTLHHYTLYKPSELCDCAKALHRLFCNSPGSNLPAIREKYSQHKEKEKASFLRKFGTKVHVETQGEEVEATSTHLRVLPPLPTPAFSPTWEATRASLSSNAIGFRS
ncbi:Cyclin-A1-3, partial [Ananas comosus]